MMSFGGFGDGGFPNVLGLRITFNDNNPDRADRELGTHCANDNHGAPRAAGDPILYTDRETPGLSSHSCWD